MKPRTTKQCEKCNREISLSNFKKHKKVCGIKINKSKLFLDNKWKQENGKYKCPYCEKEYSKKEICTHIWRNHTEKGKQQNPNKGYKAGRIVWNKGLTKETDKRVKQIGESYSNNIKNGIIIPSFKEKHHTQETKDKLSIKLSQNNKGGRCKWFDVINPKRETIKVQGTWERDFCKVLNIIDENWIKLGVGNKNHTYEWFDKEGNAHNYTPDFWCPNLKKYFEVKGY